MKKILTAVLILFVGCDNSMQNLRMPKATAENAIQAAFTERKLFPKQFPVAQIKISDEASAVKAAESVLFPVFGETEIKDERPYTIGHARGYWVFEGSLPSGMTGGVFEFIIDEKTGQVIHLTHSK